MVLLYTIAICPWDYGYEAIISLWLLYGIVTSFILFYWIFPIALRYSGVFTFYSILYYGIAVIYFSLYFALFGIAYRFLKSSSKSVILSGISIAAFYVLLEFLKMRILPGMPWFHYNFAVTQAQNLLIIQWASVGGLYIIISLLSSLIIYLSNFWSGRKVYFLKLLFLLLLSF